jgi:HPt (histidine-containing phosphotransfer) domain-containing protein
MLAINQNNLKRLDQSVLISLGGVAGLASPLIKRVVTLYQQDANQMVSGISHALSVMDFEKAFRLAHSLKSSSATIGAYVVAETAKQIESALKQQQYTYLSNLVEILCIEYQYLTAELATMVFE